VSRVENPWNHDKNFFSGPLNFFTYSGFCLKFKFTSPSQLNSFPCATSSSREQVRPSSGPPVCKSIAHNRLIFSTFHARPGGSATMTKPPRFFLLLFFTFGRRYLHNPRKEQIARGEFEPNRFRVSQPSVIPRLCTYYHAGAANDDR
jgi:hypothetical protein